jgi:hypothetical protein
LYELLLPSGFIGAIEHSAGSPTTGSQMTDSVFVSQALAPRKHASAWSLFLTLLAFVSLFPFLLVPVVAHLVPEGSPAVYFYGLIIFLSTNFHVASTGWFFTDREMHSHFRSHPLRYVIVPCALVLANGAAFQLLGPTVSDYITLVFVAWLLWHYQKQNVGLLSFIAAGTDGRSLSSWERRTLALTGLAGVAGVFTAAQVAPANLLTEFAYLHRIGAIVYLLVPIAFVVAVIKNSNLRTNRLRLFFFLIGASFYLPVFIFSDPVSAIAGCATAHGLQYLVFMGAVSGSKQTSFRPVLKMLAIALVGGITLDYAAAAANWQFAPAMKGLFVGAVMAHFVVDAGIWRLREAFQRGYMRKKFYFVFDR